jgi:hypothetical protein
MLVSLQLVGVAATPLKVTVLLPCVLPKYVPATVTTVPPTPVLGVRLEMLGGGTVNVTPLLAAPLTVTTTLPVVAPTGTGTVILVSLHRLGVPATPLKVTVLAPCALPKFVPVIVTVVPTPPEVGDTLEMLGALAPPIR